MQEPAGRFTLHFDKIGAIITVRFRRYLSGGCPSCLSLIFGCWRFTCRDLNSLLLIAQQQRWKTMIWRAHLVITYYCRLRRCSCWSAPLIRFWNDLQWRVLLPQERVLVRLWMKLEPAGIFRDTPRCYHQSLWKRTRWRMETSRLLRMMLEVYRGCGAFGMEQWRETCLRGRRQELGWLATF